MHYLFFLRESAVSADLDYCINPFSQIRLAESGFTSSILHLLYPSSQPDYIRTSALGCGLRRILLPRRMLCIFNFLLGIMIRLANDTLDTWLNDTQP